jgi:hypothetical protein
MNIIKIQDQLKSAPDDALIGYVQNPTGHVPTYLALSELQRRKEMRSTYQANKPEEKTVAEDLVQEAQPQMPQSGVGALPAGQPMQQAMAPQPEMPMEQMAQGGLAELDTGNMYDVNNYANGGIVAFGDGGHVPSYAGPEGSYVSPALRGDSVKEYIPWYKKLGLLEGLTGPTPGEDISKAYERQSMNPFLGGIPRTDLADEYAVLREKASQNKASQEDYNRMNEINNSMKSPVMEPSGGGVTPADIAAMQQKDKLAQLAQDKENALKNMMKQNDGTSGTKQKVKGLSDYTKELRDAIGTDPFQDKLQARMDKMDAAASKAEEQAPWMALAQAGFEMANTRAEYGKAQSTAADIGRGALSGIKSYGEAKTKAAELETKHFTLLADMAKAKRAEDVAIATKGMDSRDAQLAREQQDRIHQETMANQIKLHMIDNTFDLQKTAMTTAAKDLPNATERATKIKPLVTDHPDYKPRLEALVNRLGDKSVIEGTPRNKEYKKGKQDIEDDIYNELIRRPGVGSGATMNYVPGKGFSF